MTFLPKFASTCHYQLYTDISFTKFAAESSCNCTITPETLSSCCPPSDVTQIQTGIGDKLGMFFQWISAFIAGIVIGFVYGWKLMLVILAVSPLLVLSGLLMSKVGKSLLTSAIEL